MTRLSVSLLVALAFAGLLFSPGLVPGAGEPEQAVRGDQAAVTAADPATLQPPGLPQAQSSADFLACLDGPMAAAPSECQEFDYDQNGQVDLRDYQVFQVRCTEPPVPEPTPQLWQIQEALAAPDMEEDPNAVMIDVAAAAALTPPVPGDLLPTIDVQITQEIIDKAAELGNDPLAIYEFVRNECEFQAYFGSQKGSVETLRQRAGNDYDLASLLIALLRAANFPARYAVGMVEMSVEQATSWLAVDDGSVAGSILYTMGLEGISIVSGPEVVALRCRRVWVEAYVPRGYGSPAWVPLDPAFKQHDIHAGVDIPEEMGLDAQAFVDDYWDPSDPSVVLPRSETIVELLDTEIAEYLNAGTTGFTPSDVRRTSEIASATQGILPASLPYVVRSRDTSYSEIPANRRYQVRFHLHNGGTSFIDYTANLPTIAGKRITISYIGATPADEAVITSHNGLLYTPPNLINIRPVLQVDGQPIATAAVGIGAGRRHSSDMHFLAPVNGQGLPQNVVPAVYNTIVAGEVQGIGLAVHDASASLLTQDPASPIDFLGHERFATAMDYLQRGLDADREYAQLFHAYVTHDIDDAIVKDEISVVTDIFGNPIDWQWSGLVVDADRKIIGAWSVDELQLGCGGESKDILVLGGADGSLHENFIFETDYSQEAVSTIKILEIATDRAITVYKRWNSLPLPPNTQSATVRSALQNAIASGHEVTFPADPIMYSEWSGTGYIDMDPCSGAAGYIIAGGINGGATVDSWIDFIWTNPFETVAFIQGRVTSPAIDAPDLGALYGKLDTTRMLFVYDLRAEYADGTFGSWTTRSHRSKSPKQLPAPGYYFVIVGDKGEAGNDQHRRKLGVVEVMIDPVVREAGLPHSLPPTKTKVLDVTIDPETGATISFSVESSGSGSGSASVTANATRTTSGTITITGGTQTTPGKAGGLKVRGTLNGARCGESAAFSVCAHMHSVVETYHSDPTSGTLLGVIVGITYSGDGNGATSELAELEWSEIVGEGQRDNPPFNTGGTGMTSSYLPAHPSGYTDTHTIGRSGLALAGLTQRPLGTPYVRVFTQVHQQKCNRCGAVDFAVPGSGFQITHQIWWDTTSASWMHRARKVGHAMSVGGISSGAGAANVTSPNHPLP